MAKPDFDLRRLAGGNALPVCCGKVLYLLFLFEERQA